MSATAQAPPYATSKAWRRFTRKTVATARTRSGSAPWPTTVTAASTTRTTPTTPCPGLPFGHRPCLPLAVVGLLRSPTRQHRGDAPL